MRVVRYRRADGQHPLPRIGLLFPGDRVVSVETAFSMAGEPLAPGWHAGGPQAIADAMTNVKDWAALKAVSTFVNRALQGMGEGPSDTVESLDECVLEAPLRPGKLITVARNYRAHLLKSGVKDIGPVPSASIKASSVVVGATADIVRPMCEKQLDYETELVVVIGRRCKDVPADRAYEVVAGYMVMNDVIARSVLGVERRAGNQFLGKMFDTFAPLGPSLVCSDEIPDPMNLTIETRVNGQVRQRGCTRDMIWSIRELIAYFSQTTLEPGDVISTGTPGGVAAGRRPEEASWYLQPGDLIESTVEGVGTLVNRVVDETPKEPSWCWT